jgi:hypothetical protein
MWSSVLVPVPATELPGPLLGRLHELVDGLVLRVAAHRQHQLVDGHDHQDRHVVVVARQAPFDLERHDARGATRDHGAVALLAEQVGVADDAAAAGAVHDVDGDRRPLVLVDDPDDRAHEVVGAAAGREGHHDLDGLGRILGLSAGGGGKRRDGEQRHDGGKRALAHGWILLSRVTR